MRRSLAPSQVKVCSVSTSSSSGSKDANSAETSNTGTKTIGRVPLLPFLSIPAELSKKTFVVPKGCVITEQSIALRKTKTLGPKRHFIPIRPGEYVAAPLPTMGMMMDEEADDESGPNMNNNGLPPFEPLVLWTDPDDPMNKIEVVPSLACKLRPHQREGVQFLFECTMGMRGFEGQGCLLADDMGLGKTLMSITVMWTLMQQGKVKGQSAARKVMVVCPTSLVGNWENEIKKWVGEGCNTFAVKSDPKRIIENYLTHRGKGVLIISYDTQRRYSDMFLAGSSSKYKSVEKSCDLLICDEAHKLKNAESGLAKALTQLPAKMRILLSGTPMQNELTEFYNMVSFCNPGVIGTPAEFRKRYERPILAAREVGASESEIAKAHVLQHELSTIVNEFMLKRGNILNAQHLPPKLIQYVCCQPTELQRKVYDKLLASKYSRHLRDGKAENTLNSIRQLINICSHPRMVIDSYRAKLSENKDDEELAEIVPLIPELVMPNTRVASKISSLLSSNDGRGSSRGVTQKAGASKSLVAGCEGYINPEESGKLFVLYRLMQTMRAMKEGERIVIVSNYTSTLDLIEKMCSQNGWPFLRLDGTTSGTNRTKLVSQFNDPYSGAFAFLLSSKAGGCGINLIGGNRLVLFDPDWNPASDKQAAGRIWREGQKKRCYIYRFMTTCSIEEKIIQRQLSKEGLQNIVDDKEQVNLFSTEELKELFVRRTDSRSDTHDTLRCKRCTSVKTLAAAGSRKVFTPKHIEECAAFIDSLIERIKLEAEERGVTESIVPFMSDFDTVRQQLLANTFSSLPLFSRNLREAVNGVDREVDDLKVLKPFSIMNCYLARWSDEVARLSSLSLQGDTEASDAVDEEDEFVHQEGCPDEEDFNKWSHHTSVNSCDDEYLKKAMEGDNTVSFLFGLEVNWDLLQAKQLETREAEMLLKEQKREALEELNRKRTAGKPTKVHVVDAAADVTSDCAPDVEAMAIDESGIGDGDEEETPVAAKKKTQKAAAKATEKPKVVRAQSNSSDDFVFLEDTSIRPKQRSQSKQGDQSDALATEMKTASDEKPECPLCGKIFSAMRHAREHIKNKVCGAKDTKVALALTEASGTGKGNLKRTLVIGDDSDDEFDAMAAPVTKTPVTAVKDPPTARAPKRPLVVTDALANIAQESKIDDMTKDANSVVEEQKRGNKDGKENKPSGDVAEPALAVAALLDSWSCPTCTYMSPAELIDCEMCGASRRPKRGR